MDVPDKLIIDICTSCPTIYRPSDKDQFYWQVSRLIASLAEKDRSVLLLHYED